MENIIETNPILQNKLLKQKVVHFKSKKQIEISTRFEFADDRPEPKSIEKLNFYKTPYSFLREKQSDGLVKEIIFDADIYSYRADICYLTKKGVYKPDKIELRLANLADLNEFIRQDWHSSNWFMPTREYLQEHYQGNHLSFTFWIPDDRFRMLCSELSQHPQQTISVTALLPFFCEPEFNGEQEVGSELIMFHESADRKLAHVTGIGILQDLTS